MEGDAPGSPQSLSPPRRPPL
uniref:Uncharacterized protein n=1 Tax=Anguilla anguilla TaxID=7936 RepID=A0A0E9R0Z4_ANGAN